jgi:hypothetical protein
MTEFDDVIRTLRENRPEATALELDQIKQRVRRGSAPASRRNNDMKSRLAILLTLVLGLGLSTTGVGLAVQGFTNDDASVAQYGPEPDGGVAGEEDQGGGDVAGEEDQAGGVAGEQDENLQATRQVESTGGGELPFTGFLAIPVLLGGVALLSAGVVMRRRSGEDA